MAGARKGFRGGVPGLRGRVPNRYQRQRMDERRRRGATFRSKRGSFGKNQSTGVSLECGLWGSETESVVYHRDDVAVCRVCSSDRRSKALSGKRTRWGENLGAPRIRHLPDCRAGFEPRRGCATDLDVEYPTVGENDWSDAAPRMAQIRRDCIMRVGTPSARRDFRPTSFWAPFVFLPFPVRPLKNRVRVVKL